jgi:phage-related protein
MALISVTISGNATPLKNAVNEAEGKLSKFGGSAKKFGIAAAAGLAAAGAAAAVVGKQLIAAGEAASTSNARIKQIADSMGLFGNQAGAVTDRLVKLAEATARNTGVDQNAIKLTQAKLLTFGELAKTAGEVGGSFDRATQAAIDLAAAGFGEASQNAVQLGKALQDPIKGITALAKSGVTFTEAEKERIQTLVESNKVGEAQALILAAIETQVGGTAEATANASDRMKVAFSQVQERLGKALLPIFERFTKFLLDDVFPALQRMGEKWLPIISEALGKVGDFITTKVVPVIQDYLIPAFQRLADFIVKQVVPLVTELWRTVFQGLVDIFDKVSRKIQDNRENISKLVDFMKDLSKFITGTVAPILIKTLGFAFDVVAKAIDPVIDVVFSLMGAFAKLGSFLLKTAGFVLDVVGKMVNGVIKVINKAIDGANKLNPFSDIPNIPEVSIGSASLGGAPVAPTQGGVDTPGRLDRMAAGVPTIPSGTGVIVPAIPSAGGGGGGGGGSSRAGGGAGVTILPVTPDYSGIYRPDDPRFLDFLPGELERMNGGNVNITLNTVSADANLPNLIVDALQQYNLVSGPLDVQIAL